MVDRIGVAAVRIAGRVDQCGPLGSVRVCALLRDDGKELWVGCTFVTMQRVLECNDDGNQTEPADENAERECLWSEIADMELAMSLQSCSFRSLQGTNLHQEVRSPKCLGAVSLCRDLVCLLVRCSHSSGALEQRSGESSNAYTPIRVGCQAPRAHTVRPWTQPH